MKKRIFMYIIVIIFSIIMISCSKENIGLSINEVELSIGEEYQLEVRYKGESELRYYSEDVNIASISDTGLIKANSYGETKIYIELVNNIKIKSNLNVIVTAEDELSFELGEGMITSLNIPDDANIEIGNKYVATLNQEGILEAVGQGSTEIKIYQNNKLYQIIKIKVLSKITSVKLNATSEFFIDEIIKFNWTVSPLNAYNKFKFEFSDDSVLEIDEQGNVIPQKAGKTKVKIVSLQSSDIYDEIEVNVKQTLLVSNSRATVGQVGNWEFKKNIDMFDNLNDALGAVNQLTKIIVENMSIDESILINKDVILVGNKSSFNNEVILSTENIVIEGFDFNEGSSIESGEIVKNVIIKNNNLKNIRNDVININKYSNLKIYNNNFENINGTSLVIKAVSKDSKLLIEKNTFENISESSISLSVEQELNEEAFIKIYRNKIDKVNTGIKIDLNGKNTNTKAHLYARFNEMSNYEIAVENVDNNNFEFTFNYWGLNEIQDEYFINVDESNLLGFYKDKNKILNENNYRAENPIFVDLVDVVEEVYLGHPVKIKVRVLPYTSNPNNVLVSVSNKNIMKLNQNMELVGIKTGMIELLLSSLNSRDNEIYYDIKVTTDPGIHFEIDNPTSDISIGSEINIKSFPYPFDLIDEKVYYKSSNNDIATVDDFGKIKVHGLGEFIITAYLNGEVIISESLEFTSYDFNENDLMDFITKKQVYYSKYYKLNLYGNTVEEVSHNESVTRVLLSDYKIYREEDYVEGGDNPKTNFPWFIPENTPGFRPTVPFNKNIPDQFKFNESNVVWIVVHDTGSTTAGMGAYGHAKYLYNQFTNNGREASWHYTVDELEAYQHMPEDEVAYHAGDGSSVPGIGNESPALGGGNRNGIGIEMSVQRNGHIFKTWQNTAQLVGRLLDKYNLPINHQRYHQDFSGKLCPQTLIRSGLKPYFEELVSNEYEMSRKFSNEIKKIEFESHNMEIMDNDGTIIKTPNRTTQVSYTVNIETINNEKLSRTYTTIVEGIYR